MLCSNFKFHKSMKSTTFYFTFLFKTHNEFPSPKPLEWLARLCAVCPREKIHLKIPGIKHLNKSLPTDGYKQSVEQRTVSQK